MTTFRTTFQGKTTGQKIWGVGSLGLAAIGPEYTVATQLGKYPGAVAWAYPTLEAATIAEPKNHGMGDLITMIAPKWKSRIEYTKEQLAEYKASSKSMKEYKDELDEIDRLYTNGSYEEADKKLAEIKKQLKAQAEAEAQAQAEAEAQAAALAQKDSKTAKA